MISRAEYIQAALHRALSWCDDHPADGPPPVETARRHLLHQECLMAAKSNIKWTTTYNADGTVTPGATWNPLLGCSKVSAGCRGCYAINVAWQKQHNPNSKIREAYAGLVEKRADGSLNWTGKVNVLPERLAIPLGWKQPKRIFVNSLSDLFHEDVPDAFIDAVVGVMARATWHTFQVLTKRPERMAEYFSDPIRIQWSALEQLNPGAESFDETWTWPLPNVWLGTSVENQQAADERIPHLLRTPAAVRFLSCEPLLTPVELPFDNISNLRPMPGTEWVQPPTTSTGWYRINDFEQSLHWVIVGGESGPKHRPMDLEWARDLRDQCQVAGVPFFFKQVGGRTPEAGGRLLDGVEHSAFPALARPDNSGAAG